MGAGGVAADRRTLLRLGRAAFGAAFACMVLPLGPVAAALTATALAF